MRALRARRRPGVRALGAAVLLLLGAAVLVALSAEREGIQQWAAQPRPRQRTQSPPSGVSLHASSSSSHLSRGGTNHNNTSSNINSSSSSSSSNINSSSSSSSSNSSNSSNGSSSNSSNGSSSRINYILVHGRPYRQRYHLGYSCNPRRPTAGGRGRPVADDLQPLPTDLQLPGVVDFEAEITTSLRIAVVGDSIGRQIAARVEEALQPDLNPPRSRRRRHYYRTNRVVYSDTASSAVIVSHPVRGGGTLVTYRINGMFSSDKQTTRWRFRRRLRRRRRRLRPQQQPGIEHQGHRHLQDFFKPQMFNRTEIEIALATTTANATATAAPPPHRNGAGVDVLVQRVNFPWIHLPMITSELLETNTALASELFHMETMVYVNLYFSNNVVDEASYHMFLDKREVVRNFVRTYVPPAHSTLRRLLVLDMDRLVDLLNESNARSIGFNTTHEPFAKWMLSQTLGPYDPHAVYRKHIAQACGTLVPNHAESCARNRIFTDGLHFCPSTFAGRVAAGLACLVECAEQDRGGDDPPPNVRGPDSSFLRTCERACNDKYMSLDPIPLSEMVQWNGTA
jgi:hypothetical protein